ncbi:carboxypeptidase-like regulatory domain-containing protein [Micromonospora yasonensis]|uniref:carboxypeptidase-like regulatory domain-containing protein n=1 Tax=Micromonospora yasonensis TaxID=1128667 RepID=UPI00222FD4BE|nr:carboxypeptidase-like regulatory domain-containing protein [Micromonospora yasonensis]MCW3840630.1 carboxypeptidase-like regulatory domain-containing protein [Micromonospora yasonensis]
MRRQLLALTVALTAITPIGCAPGGSSGTSSPTGAASTGSGIEGRTMVDGGCPVIRDNSPCPDRPMPARLAVTRPGSNVPVATATSDPDGRFRLPLPPGDYVLHPSNVTGGLHPAAAPIGVRVTPGTYTTITVPFDSGIR